MTNYNIVNFDLETPLVSCVEQLRDFVDRTDENFRITHKKIDNVDDNVDASREAIILKIDAEHKKTNNKIDGIVSKVGALSNVLESLDDYVKDHWK